jgi:hypothetical protein
MVNLGGGGMLMMAGGMPAPAPPSSEPTLSAAQTIQVGDRDVTDVTLTLETGARLRGHVEFEGGPPPASDMPRLGISVVRADDGVQPLPPPAPVDRTSYQFTTAEYPSGRYLLNVVSLPSGWSVRSAMYESTNVLDRALELAGRDVGGLVITLTRQRTSVTGFVGRPARTDDPRAVVAAFPADYRSWIADGMTNRRFHSTSVQPNGAFELTGLTTGDYLLAAVGADETLDGRDPAAIEALARVGTRVSVRDGVNQVPNLTVAFLR